jgi:hypothetical protein
MDFKIYKNTEDLPDRPKKPSHIDCTTPNDWREYADRIESWEIEMTIYNEKIIKFRKKSFELENQFKIDALKEVGLDGHPKADKVYNKAWEFGHSSGLENVFYYLVHFSELVL